MTPPPESARDAIGGVRGGIGRVLGAFSRRGADREAREAETRASAPYTDAVVQSIIQAAAGKATASPNATGAVETAASAYGRAFAAATVEPEGPRTAWLTPEVLNLIGRELVRRGELLALLGLGPDGVTARVAGSWDVRGGPDPATWWYRLDVFGPSGNVTRLAPGAEVVHVRYAYDPSRPWLGLGPLAVARGTGRLHAESEVALADESTGPRGSLIPIPTDGEDDNLNTLKSEVPKMRGKLALVETTQAGWTEGRGAAPQSDWRPQRIGPNPPEALRGLRSDSARAVLAACGCPVEMLVSGEGTAQREAYRRFIFGSVRPLARIVARELSAKLDVSVSFDFSDLMASDIAGRARAFQSLVGGGMDLERAAGLSGLLVG